VFLSGEVIELVLGMDNRQFPKKLLHSKAAEKKNQASAFYNPGRIFMVKKLLYKLSATQRNHPQPKVRKKFHAQEIA